MNSSPLDHPARLHIEQAAENVVHVVFSADGPQKTRSELIAESWHPAPLQPQAGFEQLDGRILFKNRQGAVVLEATGHALTPKAVYRYVIDGEPLVQTRHTANGDVAFIDNARREQSGSAYHGQLVFGVAQDEHLYGLGQHEDGIYDYQGRREYLYQTNMKITIPFLLSSRNYGLLIDTHSAMVFDGQNGEMRFDLETVTGLSYYVITGENFDEIIYTLRALTGRAQMLPRWAFGYIQSKERYHSSDELTQTASAFRRLGIPMDCIVQDWFTWPEGLWGDKRPDQGRYPDLPALVDKLHEMHVKLMVSIWPNMAPKGPNYQAFREKTLLLPNSAVYDAFLEEGRALYWQQCEEYWFGAGVDAWWCDNAEPFSDADWNGSAKREEALRYKLIVADSEKSMDWTRLNTFGLYHAKGIYENWRKRTDEKRVVNLTRSTYISGQRYGVVAWSGDISAKWSVLKKQITEGIKFCMSGTPYWTLDIGAFFTVRDQYENRGCNQAGNKTPLWFWNGDFNGGVSDLGYRELYVRWLQYAAFLPVFRAHGTDTPREPWHFGKPGEPFFDTILAFIRLRYRLLPYIYSAAAAVSFHHDTMMRSLMFDFANDSRAAEISNSYMFGRCFLVCPVTEPMYYGPCSTPLPQAAHTWPVYLPEGTFWYDYWTNKSYQGGQTVLCDAPLQRMPLFVMAGSIIPLSAALAYADERGGACDVLVIYDGTDGSFLLYNDGGDSYAYERGVYCMVPIHYHSADKTLVLGKAEGLYPCQTRFTVELVKDCSVEEKGDILYCGEETTFRLT